MDAQGNGDDLMNSEPDARALDSSSETHRAASSGKIAAKRVRKPRKPTLARWREEIAVLHEQLSYLQDKLGALKQSKAYRACGECVQIKSPNQALWESVKQQHLMLAGAQTVFTDYLCSQPVFPLHRFLRLGGDRVTRQTTLLSMQRAKLCDAHAFLDRRLPRPDPKRRFSDTQQLDTPDGDVVVVLLNMEKLQGVRSVRQAYEFMLEQAYNMELRISEQLGNITIREDDEVGEKEFQQIRLVSSTPSNLPLESNTVVFRSYTEHDEIYNQGRECVIVTSDFVDEDELYPYRPNERVRRDMSGVLRLTSHKTGPAEEDVEVVVTRYGHVRLRKPKFQVPSPAWHETVTSVNRWIDFFLRSIATTD